MKGSGARKFAVLWNLVRHVGMDWMPLKKMVCLLAGLLAAWLADSGWLAANLKSESYPKRLGVSSMCLKRLGSFAVTPQEKKLDLAVC